MAVSGSKNFELNVTDYVEEAFERCGLTARTGYDIRTARRSMNLMLADWANRGLNQWTITQTTLTMVEGTRNYTLDADTIDVLNAVLRRDSTDYGIARLSRDEYLNIPTKSTESRVSQYFVDRQITPVLYVWPTPDNSTDQVIYDRLVRMDDADNATNTLQMPFIFYPALAAGMAYYIALKKAPNRIEYLKALYEEEMDRAMTEDRDRANLNIAPAIGYFRGS